VRDQVSHPYSTIGKITVLCILYWMIASILWIYSALDFIMNVILFVRDVPKYLNFATFSNDSLAILIFWFCPEFWRRDMIMYYNLSSLHVFLDHHSYWLLRGFCAFSKALSRHMVGSVRWQLVSGLDTKDTCRMQVT
jgi:hypothetical protein